MNTLSDIFFSQSFIEPGVLGEGDSKDASEQRSEQPSILADFSRSLAYSLIQSPLMGASQRIDKVAGTRLAASVDLLAAPSEAKAYSTNWFAQQIGSGIGMLPSFIAVAKLTKSSLAGAGIKSEAVFVSDANKAKPAIVILESATAGFVYNFGLTPISTDSQNFWKDAFKHGVEGAATFGTLSATAFGLRSLGGPLQGTMVSHLSRPASANIIGGITAGVVSADSRSLLTEGRFADNEERAKSIVGMVTVGVLLPPAHKSLTLMKDKFDLARGIPIERFAVYQSRYSQRNVLLPDFMRGYKVQFQGIGRERDFPALVKIFNGKGEVFFYTPRAKDGSNESPISNRAGSSTAEIAKPRDGAPLLRLEDSSQFLYAGTPSKQFLEKSKAAYEGLPQEMKVIAEESAVKVIVVGEIGEYDKNLVYKVPKAWRVYGGAHTYANVAGFYNGDVVIFERRLASDGSGKIVHMSERELSHLMAHEVGHAIDYAGTKVFSDTPGFGATYEADAARLSETERRRYTYQLQDWLPLNPKELGGRKELFRRYLYVLHNSLHDTPVDFIGRRELFAELMAARTRFGNKEIDEKFPHSAALVNRLLAK